MKREEALKTFKADQDQYKAEYILLFQKNLRDQLPELSDQFLQVFEKLRYNVPKNKEVAFIYFSFLRCDIIERNYRILVECMGTDWFADQDTVSFYISVDFLFIGINELWDRHFDGIRKYMGKITKYDVHDMIFDTVMECSRYAAGVLRGVCWDIEENQDFCRLKKAYVWSILWGEYRGETELICHRDYNKKVLKDWRALFMQLDRKPSVMAHSCWYEINLENHSCSERDFSYAMFCKCALENMDFSSSNLSGAQFINCNIRDCRFHGADLCMAKFIGCSWENVTFSGADMKYAVFSRDGIPIQEISQEQWDTMLLAD
nr:pentapeptide repeat-containing protein [uncultured Clostridium sp.]